MADLMRLVPLPASVLAAGGHPPPHPTRTLGRGGVAPFGTLGLVAAHIVRARKEVARQK